MVQGKDGTSDWYYSVPVGGTTVVSASQIQDTITSLSEAPGLADCDIWLETTIDNVAYAKMAETTETMNVVTVNAVAVTGIQSPVGGKEFVSNASCNTTGIATTKPAITYTTGVDGSDVAVTGNAGWNKTYKAKVNLSTGIAGNDVYVFDSAVSVTVDGEALPDDLTPNADGTLTVTREFTTARRKIGSVTALTVPANNTFTTYYGYDGYDASPISGSNTELGTQAAVTFTDSVNPNTEAMDVTWTVENAGDGGYNNALGAENTFRWTIPADALDNYNAAGCENYNSSAGTITGTVTMTNKAAAPVAITGTDSIAKITLTPDTRVFTENETISISGVKIKNAADEDVTGNYDIATVNGTLKIAHNTTLAPDRIEAVKARTSYIAGDTLNVDDLTVTAYYKDGYRGGVTGYTTNAAGIDMATVGDKTLTVSYTENGGTKTLDITITVTEGAAPTPTEQTETVTPEEMRKNSEKLDSGISVKWKENTLVLKWIKAAGVGGYDIFAAQSGKKVNKKSLVKTVKNGKPSVSLTKIAGKKISGKKAYSVKIKAWKYAGGKKLYTGESKTYHNDKKRIINLIPIFPPIPGFPNFHF